jgi:MFS family permease
MSAASAPRRNDLWSAFISPLGGAAFGISTGIMAGILGGFFASLLLPISFPPEIHFSEPHWESCTQTQLGVFSSSLLYGIALGSLINGPLCNKIGIKPAFILTTVVAIVFGFVMAFMANVNLMIVMRALCGLGIAGACTMTPLYVTNLASPERRGILVSLFQVFITVGILLGYLLNMAFNFVEDGWQFVLLPLLALTFLFSVTNSGCFA